MPRPPKPAATKPPATLRPKRKPIPYPFIQEALASLDPEIKPMFSGYAIYLGDKIVCMLRDRPTSPEDNGIWVVFSEAGQAALLNVEGRPKPSLRREFPSLRLIQLLDGFIKHWLLIPADSPTFESEAIHLCDRLLARDTRFGRIPKSRSASARRQPPSTLNE